MIPPAASLTDAMPQVDTPRTLHGLYLFAGPERQADIPSAFISIASAVESGSHVTWVWHQVDILRDAVQDNLLDDDIRHGLIEDISMGTYAVVIAAPPCAAWSRAVCSDRRGPPPVRSRDHPLGFPWLSGRLKAKAEQSNTPGPLRFRMHGSCTSLLRPRHAMHWRT
jgi:hypothetical protein